MKIEDRIAIHDSIALYGHLLDESEFDRLSEIFDRDAIFDLTGYGGMIYQGLDNVVAMMRKSTEHPLAHHASNIVIEEFTAERAAVISKGIGVGRKGRVGSVTYKDIFVKKGDRWLITERCVELRGYAG